MSERSPSVPAHLWRTVKVTLEMIKIEHTLFALPFALTGAVLAARGWPNAGQLFWILVAMVGARSSGMAFNRLVDLRYDRLNPRTATRALPAGLLTTAQVWVFVLATAAVLVLAAWQLNPLALTLSPLALLIVWGYSYTKRFTSFCHLFLGLALGVAPSAAWVALRGTLELPAMLLTAGVLCWAAGFDIIYSLQDQEFDRAQGLHSLPARWGSARALLYSRLLHIGTVLLLVSVGWLTRRGPTYWLGLGCVAGMLVFEHRLVRPDDLSRVNAAFFTVNGFVSLAYFCFTLLDVLVTDGAASYRL